MSIPRVKLVKKNVARDGIAAYGAALRKYNFKPFLSGPWSVVDELVHGGEHIKIPLRWVYDKQAETKPVVAQRRLKSQRGEVEAKDIGNDTEYLVSLYKAIYRFGFHLTHDSVPSLWGRLPRPSTSTSTLEAPTFGW